MKTFDIKKYFKNETKSDIKLLLIIIIYLIYNKTYNDLPDILINKYLNRLEKLIRYNGKKMVNKLGKIYDLL